MMGYNAKNAFDRGAKRPKAQEESASLVASLGVAPAGVARFFPGLSLRKQVLRQIAKQAMPLLLALGFVTLFLDNMASLDLSEIWSAVQGVTAVQWILASLATGASFWAVGRYDAVIHRHLRTETSHKTASRAGIAAIAVSQTTGFGLFTGALSRWRLLPELTLVQATQISAAVALSFLAGLAVVICAVAFILPLPLGFAEMGAGYLLPLLLLPLLGFVALIATSLLQPKLSFRGHKVNWPTLSAIFAITGLAAADTLAASGTLYALLPPSLELSFHQLYPAFLIAFAAALLSGTPGGVGPFEVTLLLLLPFVPAEPLLGAILAYRAMYYALPALLGAIILARGPVPNREKTGPKMRVERGGKPWLASRLETLIHKAPRAEANLLRQGDKSLCHAPHSAGCVLATELGQALVALGDPLHADHPQDLLLAFKNMAQVRNRLPFLYKIGGRMALEARKSGMSVTPVSREAWLVPAAFALEAPKSSQLRRKLRKAKKSEISLSALTAHKDLHHRLTEMTRVAKEWSDAHGGERGFTMGIYDPTYVQTQRCFLAYKDERLVGFVSFSTVGAEWTLDLMRHSPAIPDGTMHALVAEAIAAAAAENVPRLSLASVPWQPELGASRWARLFWDILGTRSGGAGLKQFKSSFGPHWETLYMAGPNRIGLALGAYDVTRAVLSNRCRVTGKTTTPCREKKRLEPFSQSL